MNGRHLIYLLSAVWIADLEPFDRLKIGLKMVESVEKASIYLEII